jgi:hypothetical protein
MNLNVVPVKSRRREMGEHKHGPSIGRGFQSFSLSRIQRSSGPTAEGKRDSARRSIKFAGRWCAITLPLQSGSNRSPT